MFRVLKSIALACAMCFAGAAFAGEPAANEPADDDPFAELLKNQPVEIVRSGPTCCVIKMPLPEGVKLEDIPGFQ